MSNRTYGGLRRDKFQLADTQVKERAFGNRPYTACKPRQPGAAFYLEGNTYMLQLTVKSPLSFRWNPQPPQWQLCGVETGQKAAHIGNLPFVIGRAAGCQLVLPDSEEFRRTTSRWHCHIIEKDDLCLIADGTFELIPETGALKPSVSGTFHNGRRIKTPELIKPGDTITVGPWEFSVEDAAAVNIDAALKLLQSGKRSIINPKSFKSRAGYRHLHELLAELAGFDNVEDSLAHILAFAAQKMPSAEVLAILLEGRGGSPVVRLAWQRDQGRIADFQSSSSLLEKLRVKETFLLESSISDPSASQKMKNITSALLAPLWSGRNRLGVLYLDNRGKGGSFTDEDLYLCSALGSIISLQLMTEKQVFLGKLEDKLKQYFSSNVVQRLIEDAGAGKQPELKAAEKTAAVLFVDMTGFAEFCRAHKPQAVSELLTPYFRLMSECIHRHGGYVDKFIGDAVMGVFEAAGAEDTPQAGAACALRAARAARDMIKVWRGWAGTRYGGGRPLRAGINTGRVMIGNIGFPGRMEYTALGDAVNLALRLQKLAPPDGIAVTGAMAPSLKKEFTCESAGVRSLQGSGEVEVWYIPCAE